MKQEFDTMDTSHSRTHTEHPMKAKHHTSVNAPVNTRATLDRRTDPVSAAAGVETTKAAGRARGRARRAILAAATVTVSVAGGSVAASSATRVSSVPPTSDSESGVVDELVEVGGARLHLRCSGAGDATVVLIAGLGDDGASWGAIEPDVAQSARVCSYAHLGTGTSDPPSGPQTFSTRANDLQALLRAAGEPGPYLLVGHSFGGSEAVMFASQFPTDVTGLLMLDASPATWITTLCSVVDDGSEAAAGYQEICTSLSDPAGNAEQLDAPAAFAEAAEIDSLGDLPMIVATATEHPWGLAPSENDRLNDEWNAGQNHWASLSSAAQLLPVDNTGHYIQVDRPDVVIEQIEAMLAGGTDSR
jgi:pimeloyl-ACP methyl ester carboxylesterase